MKSEKLKCCICGCEFKGYGNNPYPVVVDDSARCCNACNDMYVVRARLLCYTVSKIKNKINLLKNMRNVILCDFDDEYSITVVNRVTGWVGYASFINFEDKIKVFEGNGDGSDDAVYSFEQFVIKYKFELGKVE